MAEPIPEFDLYRELEVDPNATPETIDAAWRSLVKRHHPDAGRPDVERIKRVNLAHDWLSDPDLRARYDEDRLRKEGDWRRYESHGSRPDSPGAAGVGRDGTFSERWYGTSQAGHTDPAVQAAAAEDAAGAAARARGQTRLGLLGGAIAVVAVLGGIGAVVLRPAPAPSLPPPVTPNPTVNTSGQQERIDQLLAFVRSPDRTWQVRVAIDLTLDGARGNVGVTARVAGDDSEGSLAGSLVKGDRDWVVVGDRKWLRVDGGTWKAEPRLNPNRGWDPFARLDDEGVATRFLRWEQKGTERFAQVSLAGLLVLDPTAYFDAEYTISDIAEAGFVVDLDSDGRPARGTAQATLSATDASGASHQFRFRASYEFSDVGEPREIKPPTNG